MEHAQRVGHVFGGIPHGHSIGRGQIQSARQAAGENVRDAHAGLAEIVDRVGGVRSGIDGRCSCFDGGGTQLVHLCAGRAGVRLHGAHLLVEVRGHLHGGHAESGHGQTCCGHTAGDQRGLAPGILHARSDCSRSASGAGHRRLIGSCVRHQPDDDVLVLRQSILQKSGQMRHQGVRGRIVPAIRISPTFHGLLHVRSGPADAGFGMQCKFTIRVLADRARQTAHRAQ